MMIFRFARGIATPRPSVSCVVLLFLLATCGAAVKPESALAVGIDGVWTAVPDMPTPHEHSSGTVLLDDGNVLVTGGFDGMGLTASSLLFDPLTQSWTPTGDLNQPRYLHGNAIVKLDDGRVLIAGNEGPGVSDLASAELYDPATGMWSYTGSLNTPRRYPAVIVKLLSGKVLITGGARGAPDNNRYLASTEIYDPTTGKWTYSGNLNVPREGAPGSVLLHDGRVLVAGGYYRDGMINVAELYDPNSGQWTSSLMPYAWRFASMTVLGDGRVLVAGGSTASGVTANAMLFDPAANSWTMINPMPFPRSGPNAILLASGDVLVMGGYDVDGNPLQSTEAYDPVTGQWLTDPPYAMQDVHSVDVGAVVLANGDVFVAGGNAPGVSAEVFTSNAIAIVIDIKPGSFPNSINPTNKGVIPVAILTTTANGNNPPFDATTVDPSTVRFGKNGTEANPQHSAIEDVNNDGYPDMILQFNTQETGISCGDTSAELTGKTISGEDISGTDSIQTTGCK